MPNNFEKLPFEGDRRPILASGELPQMIMFSQEQREGLIGLGLHIVQLNHGSIHTAQELGFKISDLTENEGLMHLPALCSEVAIDLQHPFLAGSHEQTWETHLKMIREHEATIAKKVHGVRAILGSAPNYVQLARVLSLKGIVFLRREYDFHSTTTSTLIQNGEGDYPSVVTVAYKDPDNEALFVDQGSIYSRESDVGTVPLVVPRQAIDASFGFVDTLWSSIR